MVPHNHRSKIGVNTELEKAYEMLVSEFSETRVFVRCAECGDKENLILRNNSAMTVYTESELCPCNESNSQYFELNLLGLITLTHASNATGIYINEGENSLRLSNKLCGEILSGSKEYRFIAHDKTFLQYDLECKK